MEERFNSPSRTAYVDKEHAEIYIDTQGNFVIVSKSRNGITVNGMPVSWSYLKDGDLISLAGQVTLEFRRAY